jgi:hypothetical protein
MRKKLSVIAILVVATLLMTVYPAFGAISPEEKSQNIDLIIEKSGVQAQLASIPSMIGQQIQKTKNKDEKTKKIYSIIEADLAVDNITVEIKRTLSDQYNDKNAQEALKFYTSALGTKVAECEIASSDPAFQEKLEGFDIENYDQKRQQLITKLLDDMRTQDFYYLFSSSVYESLLQSLNVFLPEGMKIPAAQLNELKKKIKEQYYSKEYKQKLLADFYITYEAITNDEVAEYSKFTRSKSGKWVNKCLETGMINGFKVCTEKMMKDLAEYVANNPGDVGNDAEEGDTEEENLEETL